MSLMMAGKPEQDVSNPPRVSVFVPSYNHSAFVGQTIKSIIGQTRRPDELLIIDDGSTDDSAKVIEETLNTCPFPCEFVSRPNKGLSTTLNEGLERTAGDYFAYLGSDDIWLPPFLEARTKQLRLQSEAVLAHGNAYTIDENNRVLENSADYQTYVDGTVRPLLNRSIAPISSTVCYRRSSLERYGWNENARLEDLELYLYLSYEGSFAFDPRPLSTWRMHGTNTSRDSLWMLEECLAAQQRVAESLSLPAGHLESVLAKTSIEYALLLARRGAKKKALSLLLENWTKAPTVEKLAKVLGHCILPSSLKGLRNQRNGDAERSQYSEIETLISS